MQVNTHIPQRVNQFINDSYHAVKTTVTPLMEMVLKVFEVLKNVFASICNPKTLDVKHIQQAPIRTPLKTFLSTPKTQSKIPANMSSPTESSRLPAIQVCLDTEENFQHFMDQSILHFYNDMCAGLETIAQGYDDGKITLQIADKRLDQLFENPLMEFFIRNCEELRLIFAKIENDLMDNELGNALDLIQGCNAETNAEQMCEYFITIEETLKKYETLFKDNSEEAVSEKYQDLHIQFDRCFIHDLIVYEANRDLDLITNNYESYQRSSDLNPTETANEFMEIFHEFMDQYEGVMDTLKKIEEINLKINKMTEWVQVNNEKHAEQSKDKEFSSTVVSPKKSVMLTPLKQPLTRTPFSSRHLSPQSKRSLIDTPRVSGVHSSSQVLPTSRKLFL